MITREQNRDIRDLVFDLRQSIMIHESSVTSHKTYEDMRRAYRDLCDYLDRITVEAIC